MPEASPRPAPFHFTFTRLTSTRVVRFLMADLCGAGHLVSPSSAGLHRDLFAPSHRRTRHEPRLNRAGARPAACVVHSPSWVAHRSEHVKCIVPLQRHLSEVVVISVAGLCPTPRPNLRRRQRARRLASRTRRDGWGEASRGLLPTFPCRKICLTPQRATQPALPTHLPTLSRPGFPILHT